MATLPDWLDCLYSSSSSNQLSFVYPPQARLLRLPSQPSRDPLTVPLRNTAPHRDLAI